jgi:glycine oxidase
MRAEILIAGQGVAGTLLGWELEQAGVPFLIRDPGHETAATAASAGIINPVTGRRLVKTWRFDELHPMAAAMWRELGGALGERLWREMRVRREFADEEEREAWKRKAATAELSPYAGAPFDDGFWIVGAARVDLAAALAAARRRWRMQGRLREDGVPDLAAAAERHRMVIDCTGAAGASHAAFDFVPWEFSKGDALEIGVEGLDPDVILNRRLWVAPAGEGGALAGATNEPGITDPRPDPAARERLIAGTRAILGAREFTVRVHRSGVRVTLPDRRPVAGPHPTIPKLGICGGLGARGALWAPWLARQWRDHLVAGRPFDPKVSVARFLAASATA